MASAEYFGTRFMSDEAFASPTPDNTNWRLMPDWETPAEFMQWVRREKERLRREMAADPRLLTSPEHRREWDVRVAMEKCALLHYYGVREG